MTGKRRRHTTRSPRRTAGARTSSAAGAKPMRRRKAEGARKRSERRVDVVTGTNAARRRMKAFSHQATGATGKRSANIRAGQGGVSCGLKAVGAKAEHIAGAERSNWWVGVPDREQNSTGRAKDSLSRWRRRRMLKTYRHPLLRALTAGDLQRGGRSWVRTAPRQHSFKNAPSGDKHDHTASGVPPANFSRPPTFLKLAWRGRGNY